MYMYLFSVNPLGYAIALNNGPKLSWGVLRNLPRGIYTFSYNRSVEIPSDAQLSDVTYQIPMPEFGV